MLSSSKLATMFATISRTVKRRRHWLCALSTPSNAISEILVSQNILLRNFSLSVCNYSHERSTKIATETIRIGSEEFQTDAFTNVTPHLLSYVGRNIHNLQYHPLCLLKQRIINHMYSKYVNRSGNPLFSVFDRLSPVVTVEQNFDSLLVPQNHVSRERNQSYYVNSTYMLRPHTSAHQRDLIRSGLDRFLVAGDVYRRDDIDSTHYPVFHQIEGVRLYTRHELFNKQTNADSLFLFEKGERTPEKQECHTLEASKLLEFELKNCLENLARHVFGKDVKFRWVEAYFPFTHPSFELEMYHEDDWLELLGCGVMEQGILRKAGADDKVGWAYGIGLERWAMKLYEIPDIRLFWSTDVGFLNQFKGKNPEEPIAYKAISRYPHCINDISFWIPDDFSSNDFYDLVRSVGKDVVEQVQLIDEFTHPKKRRTSHCYRILYRHMERTLTQEEVNEIHKEIEEKAIEQLNVEIR